MSSEHKRVMFSARVDYLKARDEKRAAADRMSRAADAFYEALAARDGLVTGETRIVFKGQTYLYEAIRRKWNSAIEGTNVEPGTYDLLVRKIKKNGEPYANTTQIHVWNSKWEVANG